MNKMIKEALLYLVIGLLIWGMVAIFSLPKAVIIGTVIYHTFAETIEIIIAVFLLIGLIQVWISPQQLSKILGKEAGWKGLLLASIFPIFMGGSLFTLFPLMKILIEKGASFAAILAFSVACGGKIPLLPLEIKFLGIHFAILRLVLIIPVSIIIGLLGEFILKKWEPTKGKQTRNGGY